MDAFSWDTPTVEDKTVTPVDIGGSLEADLSDQGKARSHLSADCPQQAR